MQKYKSITTSTQSNFANLLILLTYGEYLHMTCADDRLNESLPSGAKHRKWSAQSIILLGTNISCNVVNQTSSLFLAAASVGLRSVTAGGSVTAVSVAAVVIGRPVVVRVVITTVGVGVCLFEGVERGSCSRIQNNQRHRSSVR